MVCFVVTQDSESRVSHSVFATPKHLAFRLPKKIHGSHGGHGNFVEGDSTNRKRGGIHIRPLL